MQHQQHSSVVLTLKRLDKEREKQLSIKMGIFAAAHKT
jgi:hypothetical protein